MSEKIEEVSESVYVCEFCGKITTNVGMTVWHLKAAHPKEFKKGVDIQSWLKPVSVVDQGESVVFVVKRINSKSKPVPVSCSGCGQVIAMIDELLTPKDFKRKYGESCKHCGRKLNRSFRVKQS